MRNYFLDTPRRVRSAAVSRRTVWRSTPTNRPPKFWLQTLAKVTGIGLVMVGLVWLLMVSPFFKVRYIEVKGQASQESINILNQLKGQNIFRLGQRSFERQLLAQEPTFKTIQIVRGLPNKLKISVIERAGLATWQANNQWYLLDSDGVVFKKADQPKDLAIIDDHNVPVDLGRPVAGPELLTFINVLKKVLPTIVDLEVGEVHVAETTFNIRAQTNQGVDIIFDTTEPMDRQLDALLRIWQHKRDDIKQYVDVRISGYVYYQ